MLNKELLYIKKTPHVIIDFVGNQSGEGVFYMLNYKFYMNHNIKCFSSLVENLRKEEKVYVKARQFGTS